MATVTSLPAPAIPATPPPYFAYFRSLGISGADALWLCGGPAPESSPRLGPAESRALDMSVTAILEASRP